MEEKLCSLHHRPVSDDYDSFKPCFFDEAETEEEFYDVPAPSEDIWKKFELLPTPPRSPKHETSYPTLTTTGPMNVTLEKLQMVSDILEPFTLSDFSMFPEDCALCSRDTLFTSCTGLDHEDKELNQNLKSNLIQDCMWSGHLGIALEKKVKELDAPVGTSLCNADVSVSTTVCVNPQSVFPYPLNEGETASPVNLGIDTPSDSDDDDELDDDEIDDDDDDDEDDDDDDEHEAEDEDEEIDVVSVNERHGPISDHRYTVTVAPAVSVSAHVAEMHNYTAPHPATVKSEPSFTSSSPVHSQSRKRQRSLVGRPSKRPRLTLHLNSHKVKSSRFSAASSRSSSDSEDGSEGNKRSQHNILERKRRNDLKSSFHILRDNIPELSTQERAPKVVILKKASDYITQLQKTSQLLQAEQERLRLRREQLKQKLKLLQRH